MVEVFDFISTRKKEDIICPHGDRETIEDLISSISKPTSRPESDQNNQGLWECPRDLEILKDELGRDAIFGTSAWSIYQGLTEVVGHLEGK